MQKKKKIILECGVYCSSNKELESERQESLLLGIKGSKKVQQVIQNSISAFPSCCERGADGSFVGNWVFSGNFDFVTSYVIAIMRGQAHMNSFPPSSWARS